MEKLARLLHERSALWYLQEDEIHVGWLLRLRLMLLLLLLLLLRLEIIFNFFCCCCCWLVGRFYWWLAGLPAKIFNTGCQNMGIFFKIRKKILRHWWRKNNVFPKNKIEHSKKLSPLQTRISAVLYTVQHVPNNKNA